MIMLFKLCRGALYYMKETTATPLYCLWTHGMMLGMVCFLVYVEQEMTGKENNKWEVAV